MKVMTMNSLKVKTRQQQTNFRQQEVYKLQSECSLKKALRKECRIL